MISVLRSVKNLKTIKHTHTHTQTHTHLLHIQGRYVVYIPVPDRVPEVGNVLLHLLRDGVCWVLASTLKATITPHSVVVVLCILQRVTLILKGKEGG